MANVSKKSLTLAKLEALMNIQDMISPEKLAATIQEHAQALNDIWRQVGEGKLTAEQARQEIINATGGFKKPDWMPQEEWDADESRGESFNFGGQ